MRTKTIHRNQNPGPRFFPSVTAGFPLERLMRFVSPPNPDPTAPALPAIIRLDRRIR